MALIKLETLADNFKLDLFAEAMTVHVILRVRALAAVQHGGKFQR